MAVLEKAQQADLGLEGERVHFIEEQGAAFRLGDQPTLVFTGVGVSPPSMAEQFVFDQVVGQGAAVDRDEGFVAAPAQVVDGARGQFLAAAGFAGDEDAGVIAGDLVQYFEHFPESGGVTDQSMWL